MAEQVILIAEDDPMIQKLLGRMFKRAGFQGECLIASSGTEAVALLEANGSRVVLALLDTGLTGFTDMGLFDALRARSPGLPIIASSGYSPEELQSDRHFGDRPLSGFLGKPFGISEIRSLCEAQGISS